MGAGQCQEAFGDFTAAIARLGCVFVRGESTDFWVKLCINKRTVLRVDALVNDFLNALVNGWGKKKTKKKVTEGMTKK